MNSFNSSTPDRQDTPDTPKARAVERQIAALLTDYADDMPPTVGTETRLRERLAASASAPDTALRARWLLAPRPGAPHGAGGWARSVVSLGLVAALIVGFVAVAWLRNGARGDNGAATRPCTEIFKDGKLPIHLCPPPTPVKVSIEVTQSYADAIRTVVQLRIATPGAKIPHDRPIIYSRPADLMLGSPGTALYDAQGRGYTPSDLLDQGVHDFQYLNGQDVVTGSFAFDPLPETALSAPQTLTLRIGQLALFADMPYEIILNGPWSIPFQVTPHPGRSIDFHVAPQTHNGITVQPLRLDIAPSANAIDSYGAGGARLILRVSGLDPKTTLLALRSLDTEAHFPDGSGFSGSAPGDRKLLFEGRSPAVFSGAQGNLNTVVGPTRTVDLEIIFAAPPLTSLTGTQTLTIDQITVTLDPKTSLPTETVKGPWVFALPLG